MFRGSFLRLCEMWKLIPISGPSVINVKNGTIIKDYCYKEEFCRTKLSLYINVAQGPQVSSFLLKEVYGCCCKLRRKMEYSPD